MSLEVSLCRVVLLLYYQRVFLIMQSSDSVLEGSTGSAMNDLHELTFPTISEENMTTDSLAAPDYNSECETVYLSK